MERDLTPLPPQHDLARAGLERLPAVIVRAGGDAARRFLEFFAGSIRNPNTRRAYLRACVRFFAWCDHHRAGELSSIQPLHVAAYIEERGKEVNKPSVKQELAAIRMLFDWLVVGGIVRTNPAAAVRGPKYAVRKGKTPILSPAEARLLLDSIDVSTIVGLRDRALIATELYTFGRVGATTGLDVEDCYVQERHLWLRLHEKNGKVIEMPCNHNLEAYLMDAAGIRDEKASPLFRTVYQKKWQTHRSTHGAARRVQDDRATSAIGRHRDENRMPQPPRHRHYCIPYQWRHPGRRAADGRPLGSENHEALRSPWRSGVSR